MMKPFQRTLFAVIVLSSLTRGLYAQASIDTIRSSGHSSKRINLVFLSEGYTKSQLPRFLDDAGNMLSSILSTEPYAEYKNYFNAFAISIASKESGSDHPSTGIYRDTYFQSTFEAGGIARLIGITGTGYQRANELLMNLKPEYDHAIMIVNDSVYGGSGGTIALTSIHPASSKVVIHEFGHSMAFLADEYSDAIPNPPSIEKPNVTTETRRDFIKWKIWIDASTPTPTPQDNPYRNVVGLFEGANYRATGWYRPKYTCIMRSLGSPFCEVCSEAIVLSLYERIRPIESFDPMTGSVEIRDTSSHDLTVRLMKPATHLLSTEWFLNGQRRSTLAPDTLRIDSRTLSDGLHAADVKVIDTTSLVRNDPLKLLQQNLRWDVIVQRTTDTEALTSDAGQEHLASFNYPNPFSNRTTIYYRLPSRGYVKVEAFDVLGRTIGIVAEGIQESGFHAYPFSPIAERTSPGSEMYFYRVTTDRGTLVRKMLRVR